MFSNDFWKESLNHRKKNPNRIVSSVDPVISLLLVYTNVIKIIINKISK